MGDALNASTPATSQKKVPAPQSGWNDGAGEIADEILQAHAAPEMLAALKAVEEWWLETGMKDAPGAPYAIFAVRAAIAKATGVMGRNGT